MNLLRRITSLCLVLTMVLTSGAMAAKRDSESGALRLVICTGLGPEMVLLGADGERIDQAPLCPDCTIVMDAAPHPHIGRIIALPFELEVVVLREAQEALDPMDIGPQPRAPPSRPA